MPIAGDEMLEHETTRPYAMSIASSFVIALRRGKVTT